MLDAADLAAHGYPPEVHLLAADNALVVPVNEVVHVLVTGADVIHSWTVPAFGVKIDAVPGRLNETWFKAEQEGIYFGQCSELCGKNHSYMPITVKVVSQEAYNTWLTGRSTSTAAPGRRRRPRAPAAAAETPAAAPEAPPPRLRRKRPPRRLRLRRPRRPRLRRPKRRGCAGRGACGAPAEAPAAPAAPAESPPPPAAPAEAPAAPAN